MIRNGVKDPTYERLCEFADRKGYVVEIHGEREQRGEDKAGNPVFHLALTRLRVSDGKRTVRAQAIKDDNVPDAARKLAAALVI